MAQQARIDIEAEYEAEAVAAEAESVPESIYILPEADTTVMELTADKDDTDEQMDGRVPKLWENADMEAA